MPRFTLVVPAYKVQGYLRACLDSILEQDYGDFEVVAVDDCSPDASGEILDRYAARDDRVRVLHLPQNVGLGRARNAGLKQARGDYVLFLDSDDTLTPGSLSAIAERLDATGDPEILIYDYARTYWDGRVLRNQRADLLREREPAVFPLDERPELLDLLQIVWNKAYRRDFVEKHGFEFPPGYYEDAPWTFCSLITAGRITVLDRICVHYRQRRQGGNILRTVSRKHFDVFDQYERVFSYVAEHPELDRWRPHLFRKMVDHYITILDRPGRLPRSARSEFFRRAAEDYRRRKPEGFVRPGGTRGQKFRLIALGSYPAMAGLKTVSRTRATLRRRGGERIRGARRQIIGAHYRAQLRLPLDEDLAVFSAYWSRSHACNPAAIDAELARLAPNVRRVWVFRAGEAHRIPEGVDAVRLGSREYWTAMARAKYLVNNVNFGDSIVKREGQVHIQTHHGTPLKSMGLDQRDYPGSAHGMDFEKLLARCDRWDYSLSSNRYSTAIWERVYPCSYTSLETGYPRNDILLNATAEDVLAARRELGLADGTTAVLYTPTHREYESAFVPRLDLVRFAGRLGPDTTLLVRGHYFYASSPELAALRADGRIVDVSAHPSVERLYLAADALVTDYSSAMFDYANLDRPIVIYAPDWEIYKAVRGTYFDLLQEPPGAVATSQDELAGILTSGAWNDSASAELRAAFRERFCDFDDGRAAERVVRHIFLGEDLDALPPIVPLSERRPAPTPPQAVASVETV
ncbi:bifunctional glycosyltransferase family 2 protein/CDP-glycerol:glycerophosphate glycerophosphotransferase [Streptomyces sp. DH37]|uniref:bifunctional glycosyltransferase/CDP-glycerol:glycerophosphate glycerophosphotransferase n=1 Tax=Streptomyces sp. DH37 TaxID=3040122 RepID=UPI002441781A|nr:bifunctional glycosyltransferase family 2 protein/CDP-glycerol:glycerophosphate glycerophosphotransferase [Streptomyces sp. DH37]MDG9706064.1 bifunctional glycosyltransferase family 2 protein/CDP-glycerol:glycerophosphate glycerophosphotransferase [Streptomyces sp. DH37]